MKVLIVVCCIVFGMFVGFFAGGYSYDWTHPPSEPKPAGGNQWEEFRAGERAFTDALERHQDRWPWLLLGAGLGGLAGAAVSPVLLILRQRIALRSMTTGNDRRSISA